MIRSGRTLGWAVVICAASIRVAAADETAFVVLQAPSSDGTSSVTLVDRELPAGVSVKIQVQLPGTDTVRGSLLIWPAPAGNRCEILPALDAKQRHELALVANGTGDARVLEATLPPLQLATRYCLRVVFDQMPTALLTELGNAVGKTQIDWPTTCKVRDREDIVTAKVTAQLRNKLARYGTGVTVDPAAVTRAGQLIVKLFDVPEHCKEVEDAQQKVTEAETAQQNTVPPLTKANHDLCLPPTRPGSAARCPHPDTTILAWPRPVGADGAPTLLVDSFDASSRALAPALATASPALSRELAALDAPPATDRPARVAALRKKLEAKPPGPQPLVIFLPTPGRYIDLATLYETTPAGLRTDAANVAFTDLQRSLFSNAAAVLAQLRAMRDDDPKLIEAWRARLDALAKAMLAEDVAAKDVVAAEAKIDVAGHTIETELAAQVHTEVLKPVLRATTVGIVQLSSAKAPATDEKGSWVSPNVGVLVAAPIIGRDGHSGLTTPWLSPYGGASLYYHRVDRVVDFDDLVGNTWLQRFSLTVGALLSTPSVNGKDIAGPWGAGVIPVFGVGLRFTQYLRGDLGWIAFKYANANPVVSKMDTGGAIWLGVAIDADVWAAVSGKLGR